MESSHSIQFDFWQHETIYFLHVNVQISKLYSAALIPDSTPYIGTDLNYQRIMAKYADTNNCVKYNFKAYTIQFFRQWLKDVPSYKYTFL